MQVLWAFSPSYLPPPSLFLSVCCIIPPFLFSYAVNFCGAVKTTQGGRESVVLGGWLSGVDRKGEVDIETEK